MLLKKRVMEEEVIALDKDNNSVKSIDCQSTAIVKDRSVFSIRAKANTDERFVKWYE